MGLTAQQIDPERARVLAAVLASHPNLHVLRLDRNQLDDNTTAIIAASLRRSNVRKLILDDNQISDGGAKALALLIKKGILTSISLANNNIKVLGAAALATALKSPFSQVTEVSLANNKIPRGGGDELQSAVEQVESIKKFDMRGNWFSVPTPRKIKQIMKLRRNNKKDTSDKIKL